MFRADSRRWFFERPSVRFGFAAAFTLAAILALMVLVDVLGGRPARKDAYLLGLIILIFLLAGAGLFLVYRAYSEIRDRLSCVKLYAHDILQSLSIGVLTSDLDGVLTNINLQARALTGIDGSASQRTFQEALRHAPVLAEHFGRLLRQGGEFSGTDVDLEAGGRKRVLRLDGRSLFSERGERVGVILQIQDVTQLRFIDQEMQRTEKLAGIGTLAAGIAHEIKNPLAALHIHAQLLEESVAGAPGVPKAGKYLDVIQSEIRRLQGIVDKYVSFSRPRAIERAPAALEGILDSILALVEPECRKRKVQVVREGFQPDPPRYLIDEGQLQQAILNIVINAVQAMDKGGTLTCRLGRNGDFACVDVVDTGPGIPPEVRERMFNLFFTTRQGGTGLGLYLSQRIVAEHKGYIDVKSGPGGTTFTVAIPGETPS
jgi:nitrogen-specific signal transduction histidine kinase